MNTHATVRVYVSRAALTVGVATYEVIEADSGIWEVHDANKKHFAFTTMGPNLLTKVTSLSLAFMGW